MHRFSDLATDLALPGWLGLGVFVLDNVARLDFIRTKVGNNVPDLTTYIGLVSVAWLVFVVINGRRYRQKTADVLTELWKYGLNTLLHSNVDIDKDFRRWLHQFGAWQANVNATMVARHCSLQQQNHVQNLHKFQVQAGLFDSDPDRNWWKSMMSETLDRVADVIDELTGRRPS